MKCIFININSHYFFKSLFTCNYTRRAFKERNRAELTNVEKDLSNFFQMQWQSLMCDVNKLQVLTFKWWHIIQMHCLWLPATCICCAELYPFYALRWRPRSGPQFNATKIVISLYRLIKRQSFIDKVINKKSMVQL